MPERHQHSSVEALSLSIEHLAEELEVIRNVLDKT